MYDGSWTELCKLSSITGTDEVAAGAATEALLVLELLPFFLFASSDILFNNSPSIPN